MTNGIDIHGREFLSYTLETPLSELDENVRFDMSEGKLVDEIGKQRRYPSMPLNPRYPHEGGDPTYWLALVPAQQAGKLALVEFGIPPVKLENGQSTLEYDAAVVRRDLYNWQPALSRPEASHYERYQPSVVRRVTQKWGQRHLFAALERRYDDEGQGWTQLIMSKQLDKTSSVFQNVIRSKEAADQPVPHWMEDAAIHRDPRATAKTMALTALARAVRDQPFRRGR